MCKKKLQYLHIYCTFFEYFMFSNHFICFYLILITFCFGISVRRSWFCDTGKYRLVPVILTVQSGKYTHQRHCPEWLESCCYSTWASAAHSCWWTHSCGWSQSCSPEETWKECLFKIDSKNRSNRYVWRNLKRMVFKNHPKNRLKW